MSLWVRTDRRGFRDLCFWIVKGDMSANIWIACPWNISRDCSSHNFFFDWASCWSWCVAGRAVWPSSAELLVYAPILGASYICILSPSCLMRFAGFFIKKLQFYVTLGYSAYFETWQFDSDRNTIWLNNDKMNPLFSTERMWLLQADDLSIFFKITTIYLKSQIRIWRHGPYLNLNILLSLG